MFGSWRVVGYHSTVYLANIKGKQCSAWMSIESIASGKVTAVVPGTIFHNMR